MKSDAERNPDSTAKLSSALQQLEANLETPIVPGEFAGWMRRLQDSFGVVERILPDVMQQAHQQRFGEIKQQDPALEPRVEQLREEDRQLQLQLESVARDIAALTARDADQLENRADADDQIAAIRATGLAFVLRVRTQERALTTWHTEAFQRDRGFAG